MKSGYQLTYLRICILDHSNTNIRSDRVKVIDFPHRSTKVHVWTAHWGSMGTFHMARGTFLHMVRGSFLHMASKYSFCSGMVGQMDSVL